MTSICIAIELLYNRTNQKNIYTNLLPQFLKENKSNIAYTS